jgi:hypothetical protein
MARRCGNSPDREPTGVHLMTTHDFSPNPKTEQDRRAYLDWCEECEAVKHGVAFPGPDGFGHYRYAYDKIYDSFKLDRGPGLALTWLQNAMPTYRLILGNEDADTFETTIKAVCAETRERQRAAEGWR